MAGTLVDSNVLLDVFTADPRWGEWSELQLADAIDRGPALINPIIYAEISISFARIEELEDALAPQLEREALPWEAPSLPGSVSSSTAAAGVRDARRCRTSISARTRR